MTNNTISWTDVRENVSENLEFIDNSALDDDGIALTFTDNAVKSFAGRYGNQFVFTVLDIADNNEKKLISITSTRLLVALQEFIPIENKSLVIVREGEGFKTSYRIHEYSQ